MSKYYTEVSAEFRKWITWIIVVTVIFTAGYLAGCPRYKVYSQSMRGQADFREAEINRRIEVEEARAREEALMLIASGEAEREQIKADATKYAIDTVGKALSDHPEYLRLHWVNEIAGGDGERIYIPTEAGMPILEAGAFAK
jgi:hypothetical protein